MEPTAGQWKTWVLSSGDELLSEPPLTYDSPELAAELQEMMTFTRTWQTNQTAAAWRLPTGAFESWYTFANLRMFEQGLDANPVRAARTYSLMSVAHYDAIVACWAAKYAYWYFRPFQMDATVTTVFPMPNYPSYPSGHACAATAISEVIADQFPAYAETIRARATEALESRIWAGIHFRHELVAGKAIGMAVAQKVVRHDRTIAGGQPQPIIPTPASRPCSPTKWPLSMPTNASSEFRPNKIHYPDFVDVDERE